MSAKKGKKKWITIIAVLLVIALGAGGAYMTFSSAESSEAGGTVEKITKRNIANSISGNGTVEAAVTENVTGGSYGMKVDTVKIAEGDMVAQGDVICVFNTDTIDEQIKNTKQNIKDAKADKKEQLADYDQQIKDAKESNAEQLETAKENLKQAKADLAEAKESLAQKQAEYDAYLAEGGKPTDIQAPQMENIIESKKSNVETIKS